MGKSGIHIKESKKGTLRKAMHAKKGHHALGGYVPEGYEYGLGSWLGKNAGNIAQTIGGTALMFVPGGQIAGAGMLASSVGGYASSAAEQKMSEDQEILNNNNLNKAIGQQRLDTYNKNNKNSFIPTFAVGGHLPEGKATLKDAKQYIKLYPDEMQMGEEVEYEHTGNQKLAQRIAADHIKDHLKMTGGDPGYYSRLKAAGISDELNKMSLGGYFPNVYCGGGKLALGGKLSANKASRMLKDNKAHGKPLTEKQKKYFRAVAHGWKPKSYGGWFAYGGPEDNTNVQQSRRDQIYDLPQTLAAEALNYLTPEERKGFNVQSNIGALLSLNAKGNQIRNLNANLQQDSIWSIPDQKWQVRNTPPMEDTDVQSLQEIMGTIKPQTLAKVLKSTSIYDMTIPDALKLGINIGPIKTAKAVSHVMNLKNKGYTLAQGGKLNTAAYANRGMIPSYYMENPVTNYDTGGTHEGNSLGGVPIGDKARVEQGEVRVDFEDGSYIFSNRIPYYEK